MTAFHRLILSFVIAVPLVTADELFVVAQPTLELTDETTRHRLAFGDVVNGRRLDRDSVEVSWKNATARVALSALWPEKLIAEKDFVEQADLANEIDAMAKQRDQARVKVLELYEKSYTLTVDRAIWVVMQQISYSREGPVNVEAKPPRTFRKGNRRMRRELSKVIDEIEETHDTVSNLSKEIDDAICELAEEREQRRHGVSAIQAYHRNPKTYRFQKFHVLRRTTVEAREDLQAHVLNKGESIRAQMVSSSPKWVETEGGTRIRRRNLQSGASRRVRHARATARAQADAARIFDEINFYQARLDLLESTQLGVRVQGALEGEWLVIEDPNDCAHCRRPKKNTDCRQGIIERLDSRNLKKWLRDWQDEREQMLKTLDEKWAAYAKARRKNVRLELVGTDL